MMWARIDDNGRPAEFVSFDPDGLYHQSLVWVLVPSDLEARANTDYRLSEVGGGLVPPSMDYLLMQLYDAVAARRWQHEVAGTTLADGTPVPTDDRTKTLVNGFYRKAEMEPERVFRWEIARGEFQDVPASVVIAMGDAIFDHMQACFDRASEICAALKAQAEADPTDFSALATLYAEEIDRERDGNALGWPT